MRVITYYECEICGERHSTEKAALQCESRGIFNPEKYPCGLMTYDNYLSHGMHICFCISDRDLIFKQNKHLGIEYLWATRENNNDTLNETCGSRIFNSNSTPYYTNINTRIDLFFHKPEVVRMIKFLLSKAITPKYYNFITKEIQAVPDSVLQDIIGMNMEQWMDSMEQIES